MIEEKVKQIVADEFQVDKELLSAPSRLRELTDARKAYCVLMRKYTVIKLQKIGKTINRDHATVLHAIKTSKDLVEGDPIYRVRLENCEAILRIFLQENNMSLDSQIWRLIDDNKKKTFINIKNFIEEWKNQRKNEAVLERNPKDWGMSLSK